MLAELGWKGQPYRVLEIIFGKCLVNVSINGLESAASGGHVNQARAEEPSSAEARAPCM